MDKEIVIFAHMIKPIVSTPNYQSMKNSRHHGNTSIYTHSIAVAYIAYKRFLKKKNYKYTLQEIIRAALLHDYYLYNWHNKGEGHRLHGLRHPKFSYKNAVRDYGELTKGEKDAILHHMYPLVPHIPRTKMGLLIASSDKRAALYDYKKQKRKDK